MGPGPNPNHHQQEKDGRGGATPAVGGVSDVAMMERDFIYEVCDKYMWGFELVV